MKIVFDARMFGHEFGIGVYIREMIKRLPALGLMHQWFFIVRPESAEIIRKEIDPISENISLVLADMLHYSWAEQIRLPRLINRINPDIVHFPNFNMPVMYNGKYVVTVHDLVHHLLPGHRRGRAHKRAAYKMVIKSAVRKSAAVITVSKADFLV